MNVLSVLASIRKALVPVVPAVGVIVAALFGEVSTATTLYAEGVLFLVSVGIYTVPNKAKPSA